MKIVKKIKYEVNFFGYISKSIIRNINFSQAKPIYNFQNQIFIKQATYFAAF